MNRSMKRFAGFPAMACLALILSVTAVSAGAAAIHLRKKETLRAYEGQLHKGEVHAVTFHPGTDTGHMHVSLNNGGHMTVEYPASQQAKLVAAAQAANTPVKVATVKAKKAAAVKHKLRYIAGGVLIVVIVVVLVVLLIGRRRALADGESHTGQGESAGP